MSQTWAYRTAAVLGLCLLFYFFPLLRVTSLSAQRHAEEAAIDPAAFALDYWENKLARAADQAAPAAEVAADLLEDADAAKEKYGRTLGVSRSFFLFVRGQGEVSDVTARGVVLQVAEGPAGLIELSRGALFDTALRDAPGILLVEDFADMRDFNALPAELNKLCEERCGPKLAALKPGDSVRFVGCARIASASRYKPPLKLSPVVVETL